MEKLSLSLVRRNCLECSGDLRKYVLWCPCHGVHSSKCLFWPFRFGISPQAVTARYGPGLVTPTMMPPAETNLDDLPDGTQNAADYLIAQGAPGPKSRELTQAQSKGLAAVKAKRQANP